MYKQKFMSQLNATFGSGCSFSDSQLTSFIHFIQRQCEPIPVKEAAMVIGRQPGGDVWVINPTTQITISGKMILLMNHTTFGLINLNLMTNIPSVKYLEKIYVPKYGS